MRREEKEARAARVAHKKNHTRGGERVVGQASQRWARVSARKARLLADLIRNKSVGEARQIIEYAVKPSVQPLIKRLLLSAVASVDRGDFTDAQIEGLCVGEIYADSALTIKRYRPRAMGRINQIRKRTCHITLRLTDRFEVKSLEEFASEEGEEQTTGGLVAPVEASDASEDEAPAGEAVEAAEVEETEELEATEVEAAEEEAVEAAEEEASDEEAAEEEAAEESEDEDGAAEEEDDDEKKE